MSISIKPVKTVEECRILEQLQLEIWGSSKLEVVPDHLLLTIAKEGGVVLLARTEDGTPIGFAYGFVGLTDDHRPKLASHSYIEISSRLSRHTPSQCFILLFRINSANPCSGNVAPAM